MADGSSKVVYAALGGNILVAASKYTAAALSGSSAMLTEAIHSTSDCANQLLLLVGVRRQTKPADDSHPFGYGMEIYFWTFVVAVLVLLAGGAYSLYQGYGELTDPRPIRTPLINIAVLALSFLFEGSSFAVGYRQYRKIARSHVIPGQHVSLLGFIKMSKDPSLYESLLEDGAALVGIAIAVIGTVGNAYAGALWADGAASLGIGILLLANGTAILVATRSLIAGEAVAPPLLADLWKAIDENGWRRRVKRLQTLHLGPTCILIAVELTDHSQSEPEVALQRQVTQKLRQIDSRIVEIVFRYGDHQA